MEAYETSNAKVSSPLELALPRRDGKMFVDTDACGRQIGRVLLQVQPDKSVRPIGYWSRTKTPAETRYETTHGECLAVVR